MISCGYKNKYNHPHKSTLDTLNKHNVLTYRTDLMGDIVFYSDGDKIYTKKDYQKIQDYSNSIYEKTHKLKIETESKKDEWYIEIPKIELKAPIASGTEANILNEFVGHFENTAILEGNIGLAAHNRGYKVNYFARLKELEEGDFVYYYYKGAKKKYQINLKEIIKDTNWEFLEPTKENKLTLITCVEDMPELRRCIQAIEVK